MSIAIELAAQPGASDGLGAPPTTPIVALPPIEKLQPTLRLDPATGEPRRGGIIRVAFWLFLLASLAGAGTIALTWWRAIHMDSFPRAARLIAWTHLNPGSLPPIFIAVATMLIGVVLVAAPVMVGYLAWVARPAARWWAIGALLLTGATYVIAPPTAAGATWLSPVWGNVGWLAAPLILAGGLLLWLPPAGRTFADWAQFRTPVTPAASSGAVAYGRLEQFR